MYIQNTPSYEFYYDVSTYLLTLTVSLREASLFKEDGHLAKKGGDEILDAF